MTLIPIYMMTWVNDFAMRASMPSRFIMCIFLAQLFKDLYDEDKVIQAKKKKRTKKETAGLVFAILTVILMMFPGFVNAYLIAGCELTGEPDRKDMVGSFGNVNYATDGSIEYAYVINNKFYTDGYRETFFFRYLGKT